MQPILQVSGLSKTFTIHILNGKRITALAGVSFTMEQGEILGLTGSSGSGKSTLMKCIYRTYLPSAGSIVFRRAGAGPVDIAQATEHEILAVRRTDIRYCSQFLQVIPRVPAVEVVAQSLTLRGVEYAPALSRAKAVLERLRVPVELWDAYPANFSGGEQQRINIARALISQPRFLLVDEPTASLDRAAREVVIEMIRELSAQGTSVMLISHDEFTLQRLATRLLLFEEGHAREATA